MDFDRIKTRFCQHVRLAVVLPAIIADAVNIKVEGMGKNSNATLFVDGADGFIKCHVTWDMCFHPQSQHMPGLGGDLNPRHHLKIIRVAVLVCPVGGIHAIMIGDGNHIKACVLLHIIQHFAHGRYTVTGTGVDMQI